MADDKSVDVRFGADTRGIKQGAAEAAAAVRQFGDQVNGIANGIKNVFAGALIGFGVLAASGAVRQFVQDMAALGDETEDTAAMLGVAVERIGEFEYIAEASGDSLGSITTGMNRLAVSASKAAAGGDQEASAFRRLGISVTDANGNLKSMDELLSETAESFSKHANGTEKTALAIQLFGRAGAKLIPILNEGAEGFKRYEEMAHRTGIVLSGETVEGMMEVFYATVELQNSFQGAGIALFNVFQPAIKAVVDTVSHLVQRFTDWVKRSYDTGGAMRWLAYMVAAVTSGVLTLIAAFELLFTIASGIIDALGSMLSDMATNLANVLSGNMSAAWNPDKYLKPFLDTGDHLVKILGDYKNTITEMWAAITDAPANIIVGGVQDGGLSPFGAPEDLQAMKAALDQLKQTVQQVKQTFESFFKSVISGFDKAVSGLITGTMSWEQAMYSVLDGIWSSFIGIIEDWVAKWLAGEATMLFAHESANAAKIASDLAAEDAATAKMIMDAIKAIFVDSKTTAAGVTANLAPTLGPAALPVGLAAGAAVLGLASFDVGAWSLPGDMTARVHKGEMIVPAKGGAADAVREALSGGGGKGGSTTNNHFHGAILDGAKLAKILVSEQQRNPSLRPAW